MLTIALRGLEPAQGPLPTPGYAGPLTGGAQTDEASRARSRAGYAWTGAVFFEDSSGSFVVAEF